MARFRLLCAHYLNCPGTEWEQIEANTQGKQVRHRYQVNRLLDPASAEDINDPINAAIVVTTKEDLRYPNDILFVGRPTQPDQMLALDDEAMSLQAATLFGPAAMGEAAFPAAGAPLVYQPQPTGPDPMAEFRQMMAIMQGQLMTLSAQNAELVKKLAEKEEPLEEPAPPPAQPSLLRGLDVPA